MFVSANTTNFAHDFLPTARHVEYHRARAQGGVGLVITEGVRVHPSSVGRANCLVGYREEALGGFRAIADAVHEGGALILGQLVHTGRHNDNVMTGSVAWGPSALRWDPTGLLPHPMSVVDIVELREHYVKAALLLQRAGYDGVEIHIGHGHLLHQFLSENSNSRSDSYGGSLANRCRIITEILLDVRSEVGPDFVLGIRVSGDDFSDGGLGVDDAIQAVSVITNIVPSVDFIDVTHAEYTKPSVGYHVADMSYGDAPFTSIPAAFVDAFPDLPVFAICRVTSLQVAERVLAETGATLVGMTRAHIADAAIVRKSMDGRENEVRPCVSCNFCVGQLNRGLAITCMMNPTVGREVEWPDDDYGHTHTTKRVVVVGAGPAGLEAARVAAERGHVVEIWESSNEPGGLLRAAKKGVGRSDLGKLVAYEVAQLERLNVPILYGRRATSRTLSESNPDAVIVATGRGKPAAVGGIRAGWMTPEEYLTSGREVATLVVDDRDGSWAAASVAETAAKAGASVTVVSAAEVPFLHVNAYSQMLIVERLRALGVRFVAGSRLTQWDGVNAILETKDSGSLETLDAGLVVVSDASIDVLAGSLEAELADMETHVVGDALAPRDLLQAMSQAHEVGRNL